MNSQHFSRLMLFMMIGLLTGACSTSYKPVPAYTPVDVDADGYTPNVENVVMVLDTSSSMAENHGDHRKFDIAIATVRNLIQTIPAKFPIQSTLRTFGHDPAFSTEHTIALGKMKIFHSATLVNGLTTITGPGGTSPLEKAICATADDINGSWGDNALIIVSDAKDMGASTIKAAMSLKEKYKENLCIYPIQVGDDPDGKVLMEKLARIGECGFATNADDLSSGQGMADYVSKIFVGEMLDSDGDSVPDIMDNCPETASGVDVDDTGCPIDSDADGVPDNLDRCPQTRTGMKVDASGCPHDSDGDDVPDPLDKCPETPAGTTVDGSGCPHTVLKSDAASWIFSDISFGVGKADISPNSYSMLDEIAAALIARPDLKIVVEGHTDNTGAKAVNRDLSQRRAQSVVDYLEAKGISASRLSAKGIGPDRPIADNATKPGRARNRRVEFVKVDD